MGSALSGITGAVGDIAGGILGSNSSSNAAQAQVNANQKAASQSAALYNQAAANYQPYISAGNTALSSLMAGEGNGAGQGSLNRSFTMADFQQNPAYQFNMQQGLNAISNAQSVRGGALSGGGEKAAMGYAQNNASNAYQQAYNNFTSNQQQNYNQLAGTSQMGLNATSGLGNLSANQGTMQGQYDINQGTAQASGIIGSSNSLLSGGMGALASLTGSSGLSSLLGGSASGVAGGSASGVAGGYTGGLGAGTVDAGIGAGVGLGATDAGMAGVAGTALFTGEAAAGGTGMDMALAALMM